ncbi:MAG: sugar phosphate isomerase/epimerase family protein [Aristaeellaceae bacterium]
MTGIYDCFGYGEGYDVPFPERYRLIREAGFDSVMLWWSDRFGRGEGYRQDAQYAGRAGLMVENIHAPVHQQNDLSLDTLQGEAVYGQYAQCVEDCAANRIPTVVIHLPDDGHPILPAGMERLRKLVALAEDREVQLAFENLRNLRNLSLVLESFPSRYVGFCYDSCHHQNCAAGADLLAQYGGRMMALHLHDNGGARNQHRLPFDGDVDWAEVMHRLARTGYPGATSLEPMNWDYGQLTIRQFLALAYRKARALENLRA